MFNFGLTFLAFGAGSMVLNLFDFEFIILMWIDNWGPEIGWWIRGSMIALGCILCLVGVGMEDSEAELESE